MRYHTVSKHGGLREVGADDCSWQDRQLVPLGWPWGWPVYSERFGQVGWSPHLWHDFLTQKLVPLGVSAPLSLWVLSRIPQLHSYSFHSRQFMTYGIDRHIHDMALQDTLATRHSTCRTHVKTAPLWNHDYSWPVATFRDNSDYHWNNFYTVTLSLVR